MDEQFKSNVDKIRLGVSQICVNTKHTKCATHKVLIESIDFYLDNIDAVLRSHCEGGCSCDLFPFIDGSYCCKCGAVYP